MIRDVSLDPLDLSLAGVVSGGRAFPMTDGTHLISHISIEPTSSSYLSSVEPIDLIEKLNEQAQKIVCDPQIDRCRRVYRVPRSDPSHRLRRKHMFYVIVADREE